jgi:hypothetical protein
VRQNDGGDEAPNHAGWRSLSVRRSHALFGLAGAALGVGAWLLIVPWDLSEVDEAGRIISRGGDDNAVAIMAVAAMVWQTDRQDLRRADIAERLVDGGLTQDELSRARSRLRTARQCEP